VEVCRHIYQEISKCGGVQTHLAGDISKCGGVKTHLPGDIQVWSYTDTNLAGNVLLCTQMFLDILCSVGHRRTSSEDPWCTVVV
jgi:hypothetical protein